MQNNSEAILGQELNCLCSTAWAVSAMGMKGESVRPERQDSPFWELHSHTYTHIHLLGKMVARGVYGWVSRGNTVEWAGRQVKIWAALGRYDARAVLRAGQHHPHWDPARSTEFQACLLCPPPLTCTIRNYI